MIQTEFERDLYQEWGKSNTKVYVQIQFKSQCENFHLISCKTICLSPGTRPTHVLSQSAINECQGDYLLLARVITVGMAGCNFSQESQYAPVA